MIDLRSDTVTRLVVHRDLDDDAIERVLEAFTDYFTTRTA